MTHRRKATAVLIGVLAVPAFAEGLAEQYGYAFQAGSQCQHLQNNRDTEGAVSDALGHSVRDTDAFEDGLYKAIDEQSDLCSKAADLYGCNGIRTPGLVQEKGLYCVYNE